MKKHISLIALVCMIMTFAGCVHSEFVDPVVFCENFSQTKPLSLTDFYSVEKPEGKTEYFTYLTENESKMKLSLLCDESGRVAECRVTFSKPEKGKEPLSSTLSETLQKVCKNALSAFTYNFSPEVEEALCGLNFALIWGSDNTEQKAQQGSAVCYLLSDALCCEFIVRNKWLIETEITEKPENKKNFAEATSIRTETVPLQ